MKTKSGKWISLVGALTLGLGAVTTAMAANVTLAEQGIRGVPAMFASITTNIDHTPAPPDTNGTCFMCWADTDAAPDGSEATLDFYFEDDGQDFNGDLSLLLDIDGEGTETAVIENVSMDDQTSDEFIVDAGATWDWNDVTRVTVKAVPG